MLNRKDVKCLFNTGELNMISKICKSCLKELPLEQFPNSVSKSHPDGKTNKCKCCTKHSREAYRRTPVGLSVAIYTEQNNSSKSREHPFPSYTREELYAWLINQGNFKELYASWVQSNYNKWLLPSVDRIDNSKPYSMDNIQLVTFKENNQRSHVDASNGEFNTLSPVDCYTLTGEFVSSFKSMNEAARVMEVSAGSIHNCCNSTEISPKKYLWKYSKNKELPKIVSYTKTYTKYDDEGNVLFESNAIQEILDHIERKDMSPLNKSIRKNRKYLGFKWGTV